MKVSNEPRAAKSLALIYLARGADLDHLGRFRRFVQSYRSKSAGVEHTLFVIFKGFDGDEHLRNAREIFSGLEYHAVHTGDETFDIGAYAEAVRLIHHDRVCVLNSASELVCEEWLAKLSVNLDQPYVGMVAGTGSFESLRLLDRRFPYFPNPHLRSNAFMMERKHLVPILSSFQIRDKLDAWLSESGPAGITRRVFELGLSALIVGRDGRGYTIPAWPVSRTFRQEIQDNLLVHDNATRAFEQLPWSEKKESNFRTWGERPW